MPPSSPAESDSEQEQGKQSLTLAVLRHLLRTRWSRLPGETLVVLCADASGNSYSPFSTLDHARYSPVHGLHGEVYPLESDLANSETLRALFPEIPDNAVAALVLYPLD
ncbi:hypothetical protein ACFYPC_35585 [Streptomyces sp. NPDC005808]|uniref:hypothetical protein n=1 Tax=Streptomyces sp. NPDC005808 TaxID=3364734 RepID=UPI0036BC3CE5